MGGNCLFNLTHLRTTRTYYIVHSNIYVYDGIVICSYIYLFVWFFIVAIVGVYFLFFFFYLRCLLTAFARVSCVLIERFSVAVHIHCFKWNHNWLNFKNQIGHATSKEDSEKQFFIDYYGKYWPTLLNLYHFITKSSDFWVDFWIWLNLYAKRPKIMIMCTLVLEIIKIYNFICKISE